MNLKQRILVVCLVIAVAAAAGLAMSAQTEIPASPVTSIGAACPAQAGCPPECRPTECSPEERAACAQRTECAQSAGSCGAETAQVCKAKSAS